VSRVCAIAVSLSLVLAGAIDAWRVVSGAATIPVFDTAAVEFARMVVQRTPRNAVVARAPTYDHAALLTGRPSLLGDPRRLDLQGLDSGAREQDLKCIFGGCDGARRLLSVYGIGYLIVGPQERRIYDINDGFLETFPIVGQTPGYQLRRVSGESAAGHLHVTNERRTGL